PKPAFQGCQNGPNDADFGTLSQTGACRKQSQIVAASRFQTLYGMAQSGTCVPSAGAESRIAAPHAHAAATAQPTTLAGRGGSRASWENAGRARFVALLFHRVHGAGEVEALGHLSGWSPAAVAG